MQASKSFMGRRFCVKHYQESSAGQSTGIPEACISAIANAEQKGRQ
jgi:hypothetical protein